MRTKQSDDFTLTLEFITMSSRVIDLLELAGAQGIPKENLQALLATTYDERAAYHQVINVLSQEGCLLTANGTRYFLRSNWSEEEVA